MDAARLGAVQDELGELVGLGLRTEPFERAGIARSEHPPRGLALGAVLAHQHRGSGLAVGGREAETDHGTLRPRGLGSLLDVDAPCLREVHRDAVAVVEAEEDVLPASVDLLDDVPDERVGLRRDRLQRREPERVRADEPVTADRGRQPFSERLHLR